MGNAYVFGNEVQAYDSMESLSDGVSSETITLSYDFGGTGQAVYDGYLYYNEYGTNRIRKFDLRTNTDMGFMELTEYYPIGAYPYSWDGHTDIDLAVDEEGLWVIYTNVSMSGRLIMSRIDGETLSVTWTIMTSATTKTELGNAFMICGNLYAIADHEGDTTVSVKADTITGAITDPGIPFESPGGYNTSVSYNPQDRKLYSWDNGQLQTYDLTFRDD